jgi:hypothetical protein
MNSHLADLRLSLERMCRYELKMNLLKYVFIVSVGKFLGFIIHEHGIEISPTNVRTTCKNDMQKFLGKLNYLRQIIFNLSRKISAFAHILQLMNEAELT